MRKMKNSSPKKSGSASMQYPNRRFRSYIQEKYHPLLWKCNEGKHLIDIVPYLAGVDHPILKKGQIAFELDIYVQRGIGLKENLFICLLRVYGKPCPICEEYQERRKSNHFEREDLVILQPIRRTPYNILVHDDVEEKKKGVWLWDIPHYLDG